MPKNPKRGHLGSLNVFYKPKISKKCKVPFDKIRKFSKSRIVPKKKPKGGPFCLTCTFGSIKNYGLVRESNPRSPGSGNGRS